MTETPMTRLLERLGEALDRADREESNTRQPVADDTPFSTVPGHLNDTTGRFCDTEGQETRGGRCPKGCDHADHYANDGHPECEETVIPTPRSNR